ncbi:MAG: metallophosphoesterase family protein [Chloroflexia bacterium]|nr:metallophosphoesterase family protein [Chloroflexia bacterium]
MRFGVFSDIHANLVALQAVLQDMGPVDQYWCLGDVVGYGPSPNECVQALLDLDHVLVMGNHDAAAVGVLSPRDFNGEARRALEWTARTLARDSMAYLKAAPEQLTRGEILLVHGSPREPLWEYITNVEQAQGNFAVTENPYTFIGHTHVPLVFLLDREGHALSGTPEDGMLLRLAGERMLINPGSVGQPRDGDPRASYAIVDNEQMHVEFHRVEYDIPETQSAMKAMGASPWLMERIAYGR